MKKMISCSLVAMFAGMGMMAYILNHKSTKENATKFVNDAMDMASNRMRQMK